MNHIKHHIQSELLNIAGHRLLIASSKLRRNLM